jgi:AraC family transcriptional regulator
MPRLHELQGRLNEDVLSVNVYPSDYFERFDPHKSFQKRAVAEVEPGTTVPEGMHEFNLPGGRYAVFTHRGHSKDTSIFQRIYGEWIPCSGYDVDDRPHFERLGPKYNINSEDAEEEIWIPIKTRTR